ncbi:MAG: galactokinase [Demequinaceae bacterium]|nr:galactokinase [Demequinaceae bacterium]
MTTATETHFTAFGSRPQGTWSAPGRVNLVGEHTDYNNGLVLPFAIDRRTTCAVSLTGDDSIRVASTHSTDVVGAKIASLAPSGLNGWSAYPLGVAWALVESATKKGMADRVVGCDLSIASDVPIGAGLSSSAAIECAVAVALNELWGLELEPMELVLACQRAENIAVGAPTGIMDQTASLFGVADHAVLLDCDTHQVQTVALGLEAAGLSIMVIDSKVEHSHATGGYKERRADCETGAAELGVTTLRALSIDDLARARSLLSDRVFRRVRHVVTENERVLDTVKTLASSGPTAIGELLLASHASMRDDFEISVPEIDAAVEAAVGAGALGARLTGGGFGGASIALVPTSKWGEIAAAVSESLDARSMQAPHIFEVRPSNGAQHD